MALVANLALSVDRRPIQREELVQRAGEHSLAEVEEDFPMTTQNERLRALVEALPRFDSEVHQVPCVPGVFISLTDVLAILAEDKGTGQGELTSALRNYGTHKMWCPHVSENMRSNTNCECGWYDVRDALLGVPPSTGEPGQGE